MYADLLLAVCLLVIQSTSDLFLNSLFFSSLYSFIQYIIDYLLSTLNASLFATTTLWLLAENHPIDLNTPLFSKVICLPKVSLDLVRL